MSANLDELLKDFVKKWHALRHRVPLGFWRWIEFRPIISYFRDWLRVNFPFVWRAAPNDFWMIGSAAERRSKRNERFLVSLTKDLKTLINPPMMRSVCLFSGKLSGYLFCLLSSRSKVESHFFAAGFKWKAIYCALIDRITYQWGVYRCGRRWYF